jgi:hypothetical protein
MSFDPCAAVQQRSLRFRGPNCETDDPRRTVCDTKFFGLRPKPLERYVYRLNLPRSAERVFWLHWDAGRLNGNWCSEVPISRVAQELWIDESSVVRAYQILKKQGLLRRQDPGRDPQNPYRQATAITEVLLPREAIPELMNTPNRLQRARPAAIAEPVTPGSTPRQGAAQAVSPAHSAQGANACEQTSQADSSASPATSATELPPLPKGAMKIFVRATEKLDAADKAQYDAFVAGRAGSFVPQHGGLLSPEELEVLIAMVIRAKQARERRQAEPLRPASAPIRTRKEESLNAFCIALLSKKLKEELPLKESMERLREIVWSIEHGQLKKLDGPLAKKMNIALKKVTEGKWTRPHKFPPNWRIGSCA